MELDTPPDERYGILPHLGPHEVGVGHALINMSEPWPGYEHAYNHWYEHQHFFDGAMHMPWMFAGRRFTATHDLLALRYPAESAVARPITAGCYIGIYWVVAGRAADHMLWSRETNIRLEAEGKKFPQRDFVYAGFHDHVGTVYRSDEVPRDVFSLMDPSPGLVLEVIDAESAEGQGDLASWLHRDYLPSRLASDGLVSSAMVFTPHPAQAFHDEYRREQIAKLSNGGTRTAVLWFLDADPRECWDTHFVGEDTRVASGRKGKVVLVAPFIPSKMGTTQYEDQLRPGLPTAQG